jgi:heterodisulfide reductase subunit D
MKDPQFSNMIIDVRNLTWQQMMELDACTRCGECVKWCPVYAQDSKESVTPRDKLRTIRKIIVSQYSLRRKWVNPNSWLGRLICPKLPSEEEIMAAVKALYECSTCRQCHFVCPSRIDTVELYEALRRSFVDSGIPHIDTHLPMVASVKDYDNPWKQPRSQRARWAKVAKKEGRIKETPKEIKLPKNFQAPSKSQSQGTRKP